MSNENQKRDIDNDYTVKLSPKGYADIEKMKEKLNMPSSEDLLNLAISLAAWAVKKSENGDKIGAINNESSTFVKLNISDLDSLREQVIYEKNKENVENNN